MKKHKSALPYNGEVGMDQVFGGPRPIDQNAMNNPYSGAMTRMDQRSLNVADQMFGTNQMRQYGMNITPGSNSALMKIGDPIPGTKAKKYFGELITRFNNRQFPSLDGDQMGQLDYTAYASVTQNLESAQSTGDNYSNLGLNEVPKPAPRPQTPQDLRRAERVKQTADRIKHRENRRNNELGNDVRMAGGSFVGNLLRQGAHEVQGLVKNQYRKREKKENKE